uniref:Secreted protein n=1 Tax=Arundo donax TaxID=35708 RepID=A0A0A9FKP6_ARUDO
MGISRIFRSSSSGTLLVMLLCCSPESPLEQLVVVVVDEDGDGTGTTSAPADFFFFFAPALCSCPPGATRFFKCVFQTFLISLSVRPGRHDAIFDHLLPSMPCSLMMASSSSAVKLPRLRSGRR